MHMFFIFKVFICLGRIGSYLKWQLTTEPLDKIFPSRLYLQKMFARSKLIGNNMLHVIPYFYDSGNWDLRQRNYFISPNKFMAFIVHVNTYKRDHKLIDFLVVIYGYISKTLSKRHSWNWIGFGLIIRIDPFFTNVFTQDLLLCNQVMIQEAYKSRSGFLRNNQRLSA